MKSKYFFYFDESFHDRKITITSSNELNIFTENKSDIFVGAFIGVKTNNKENLEKEFSKFEEKYKEILGVDKDAELKATTIKKRNFNYGFRSFNKNTIDFYNDFFDILINNNTIFQINFFSKIEFLITETFREVNFDEYFFTVNKNAFLYSLIKFIFNYKYLGIAEKLFLYNGKLATDEIINEIKLSLKIVLKKISSIKRKEMEKKSLKQMLEVLNYMNSNVIQKEKINWDYNKVFQGFNLLLNEMKIKSSEVELRLDEENNILKTALKNNNYISLESCDSKEVIGIRIADILSNFFGRCIFALQEELLEDNSGKIRSERKLISDEWFDLSEKQFKLVKKLAHLFGLQFHYSTYVSLYFDYPCVLFNYIHYINTHSNYTVFKSNKSKADKGNNFILMNIHEQLKNL